ncbi:cAMP-binding protein [Labilithrix luteola]|uniref:cAMP-binding protein n=1 Tax=Labilithrix luteola TaxID=1391654 RepID=A0A0K1Q5S5_9BACT|nr:cyclic nucleotide-binding domain-containing protein [Labilithrix luteola]AKV00735.1 cAMP-binding protein [Labilithrix luteola]
MIVLPNVTTDNSQKRDILRRVRVFADLGDAECDAVLGVLRARRGAPGDVLFREGDPGHCLMIVLDGQLVASVASGGSEEVVARLGPGEVVGEMAFVDAEPRSATVSAPSGATILEFSRAAMASLQQGAPRVAAAIQRNVLADVARRLRDAGEKLADGGGGPSSMRGAGPESRRAGRGLTVEQLRRVPALAEYGSEDLELLAYIATLRSFAPRDVLMQEGSEGDACWLLLGGAVDVTRAGVSTVLATLGPGALVGQLALLDRAPRSATVTAVRETHALEVRANAFSNLLKANSPVALRFQEQVALAGVRQLRAATRKLAEAAAAASSPASTRMRMIDDWDEGDAPKLELSIEPSSLRRL